MATKIRENGLIGSTITGKEPGSEKGHITVIRQRIFYDELVFDNKEQFEYWKNLRTLEEDEIESHPDFGTDTFEEFNEKNFVKSFFEDDEVVFPEYAAFIGDQTICTDDIVDNGHFHSNSVEQWDLSSLGVSWDDCE